MNQMNEEKFALFAFNGDEMCFVHVLLNAIDFHEKGYKVETIIEGSATRLLPKLHKPEHSFHSLYQRAKDLHLIRGVCRACAHKMGTLQDAEEQALPILADMKGHPGIAEFVQQGYTIITF